MNVVSPSMGSTSHSRAVWIHSGMFLVLCRVCRVLCSWGKVCRILKHWLTTALVVMVDNVTVDVKEECLAAKGSRHTYLCCLS
jgi:hypothetical protein